MRVFAKIYDAIGKRFLISAHFALLDYVAMNGEAVQRYARALHDANIFANAHHDQTAQWLAEFAKIDIATVQRSTR